MEKGNKNEFHFLTANARSEFEAGNLLFREYAGSLDFDLSFQRFESELEEIGVQYNKPTGGLILIKHQKTFIGCAGIRKFKEDVAELKRMYIQTEYRGCGLGKILLEKIIKLARELGYKKVRLDTISTMVEAVNLYRQTGFRETEAYRFNPNPGVLYFEKDI